MDLFSDEANDLDKELVVVVSSLKLDIICVYFVLDTADFSF